MVDNSYQIFVDIDATALEGGYVWVGAAYDNPEVNPSAIYWDAALTILAAQPLRTSGGYIVRAGTPANVYTAAPTYSVVVNNMRGKRIFYTAVTGGTVPASRVVFPVPGGPPGAQGPSGPPGPYGPPGVGSLNLVKDIATLKGMSWSVGQRVSLGLYEGCSASVEATPVFDDATEKLNETLDFDDELNIVVPLIGGGTGMLRISPHSVLAYARAKLSQNVSSAKLAISRALAGGERVTFKTVGDSKTYGQNNIALTGADRVPTGFDDNDPNFLDGAGLPGESKHLFGKLTQVIDGATVSAAWPDIAQGHLRQLFGNCIDVHNGGYSGDRTASSYRRHVRWDLTANFTVFALGINDVLYTTSNGQFPANIWGQGNWSIDKSAEHLLATLIRDILRGSVPMYLAPCAIRPGNVGYDTTIYAVNKLLMQYKSAWRKVCDLVGIAFIDEENSVGRDAREYAMLDGIHFAAVGAAEVAAQVTAALAWVAYGTGEKLYGPAVIQANVSLSAIAGQGGTNNLAGDILSIDDASSMSRPFGPATTGAGIALGEGGRRYFPVWLETDELEVMPIGRISINSFTNRVVSVFADFAAGATFRKVPGAEYATRASRGLAPPIGRNFYSSAVYERVLHHEGQFGGLTMLQGRGPHLVCVEIPFSNPAASGGPTLFLEAIKLVAPTEWQPLTLLAGFEQQGDIEPAWRYSNGRVEYRGLAYCVAPASPNQAIFIWPAIAGVTLLASKTNHVSAYNNAQIKMDSGVGIWALGLTPAENVFDLSVIVQAIGTTAGN